jgi:ribosomal protein S27E
MANVKLQCEFCGKTNTKFEPQYASSGFLNLGSTKVGEREVVDWKAEPFYRCVGCGRILCEDCNYKISDAKKKIGIFSTERWRECPKCHSKMIKLD